MNADQRATALARCEASQNASYLKWTASFEGEWVVRDEMGNLIPLCEEDADFIASARSDIPAYEAALTAAEQRITEMKCLVLHGGRLEIHSATCPECCEIAALAVESMNAQGAALGGDKQGEPA